MATGSLGRRWMPASTVCASLSMCACAFIKHRNGSRFSAVRFYRRAQAPKWLNRWIGRFLSQQYFSHHPSNQSKGKSFMLKYMFSCLETRGASSARCERQGIRFHVDTIWELQSVKKKKKTCHWRIISSRLMMEWELINAPVLVVNSLKCNYCSLADLNIISSLDYKPRSLIKKSALPIGSLTLYGKTLY